VDLIADPIPQLVRRIAIPAGTGMMFNTLFNITDTWFAGLLSTDALAALSLSFPVFFIVIASGVGLGQGTSALIANALGAGTRERAMSLWVQSLYLVVVIGVIIACIGLFALAPILGVLTSDEALVGLTAAYLMPLMFTAVFFAGAQASNALLVARGDSRSYRNSLIVGFFANIALNPLFMFGAGPLPGSGVAGIALATIMVQAGQLAYLLYRIRRCGFVAGRSPFAAPDPALLRALGMQVFPASLSMLSIGVGLFIITHFVGRFGPEAVAAYGIGLRIEQLAMLPMVGLGIASITIVGQNLGAARIDRVREAARFNLLAASVLMGTGAVLVAFLKLPILRLFSDDPEVLRIGSQYLAIAVMIFIAYGILNIGVSVMQGLKKPVAGLVVGLSRHVVAPPLVLTFAVASFGLVGVFWSIFAMSWCGALMIAVWLHAEITRVDRLQAAAGPAAE
jgi:putative MATE family efflux protein